MLSEIDSVIPKHKRGNNYAIVETVENNLNCNFSVSISVKDEERLPVLRLLLYRQLCHFLELILNF